jgi:hypothetical protein
MVRLDIRFAEDLREGVVELAEPTEDDETSHCVLPLDVVLRFDVAAFGSQAGLYESSVYRPLTRFRLRAFPSRAPVYATSSCHCRTDGSELVPHCASPSGCRWE